MGTENHRLGFAVWTALGLIALGAVALRVPGITTSATFIDEGARIAVARPIAEGSGIYTDVTSFGAPGAVLFNALILALFGPSVLAVRLAYLAVSLATLALVFDLVRRLWSAGGAVAAAFLFAASPLEAFYSYHAMSEPLMNLLVVASLAAIARGLAGAPGPWLGLAGALAFGAFLVKQPALLLLPPVVVALAVDGWRTRDAVLLRRRLVGFFAGYALALLVFSLFLLADGGWLQWFREMFGSRVFRQESATGLTEYLRQYSLSRGFMVLGVAGLFLAPGSGALTLLVRCGALVMTAFTLTLPLNYGLGGLSHYLLISECWWIVLAGGAVHWLLGRAPQWRSAGAAPRARWLWLGLTGWALVSSGLQLLESRRAAEENAGWFLKLDTQKKLATRLEGTERALVLANPIYYFYAGTRPPMRPMDYFLVFRLRFLQADAGEFERVVLRSLQEAEMLFIDSVRFEIIRPVLDRADAPGLRLVEGPPGYVGPALYSIERDRGR